ncbi:virulence protein [Capnocytophaga felis]|uniref:Uncharacterized protein n=1 Tax=Capnocytophaga felis TaxID=2267611 RepID=A0A5M4B982_9FLAO|nr:virulence protein [Capnocytophaga felis]GET45950.1 hypothetical protein RCZ01_12520 [Capnocytophaga felis]GET49198.1 hypothetical protein RCZ02_20290 [Capnocytophaga felis]
MYAILFDIDVSVLKQNYGESYPKAYDDIKELLKNYDFYQEQKGVYFSKTASKQETDNAIEALSKKDWFLLSVKKVQTFKIEDWNDFTPTIQEKMREVVFKISR